MSFTCFGLFGAYIKIYPRKWEGNFWEILEAHPRCFVEEDEMKAMEI